MLGFKGLIPKNLTSDQAMGVLIRKTEQFRKISSQSSQITSSLLKIFEIYLLQLPRIINLLHEDHYGYEQFFYKGLRSTYIEIYKEYQSFTLDHVQSPSNQIKNTNGIKYVNFSNCLLTFQQQLKNYCNTQVTAFQFSKKYFKTQKSLLNSIQVYKQSFTQAKLIYNMDQKLKRYASCQQNYKLVAQDHGIVMQMRGKLQQKKKQISKTYQALIDEMANYENEIDIKTYKFLSNFNINLCDNIKKRLEIAKEGYKKIEKLDIATPFQNFNIEESEHDIIEQKDKQNDQKGRRKAGLSSNMLKSGQIQLNIDMIRKLSSRLQKRIELVKVSHLNTFQFHIQFYKNAEKKSMSQLKQSYANFEKNRKKIKQQFLRPSYQQLKNTLNLMKTTMDIYIDVHRKIGIKIQSASESIEEMKNIFKGVLLQTQNIIQKAVQIIKQKEKISFDEYRQKIALINQVIKSADEKLFVIMSGLKSTYLQILNTYETGLQDSFDRTIQIGKRCQQSYKNVVQTMKDQKIQRLKQTPFYELLNEQNKGQVIFLDDAEKNSDFKKLKKPVQIEIIDKQKQKQKEGAIGSKQQMQKQQCENDGEERGDQSPLKSKKKHREFLQTKIAFIEGEELLKTFSCALADKIILQGRLYVTSQRVCFFSSFNPSTVFFGDTFIQIPKKDIITLQKRKNGIFFDNSISLTTVKGEVFLTSFFKRNEAFTLLSRLIGVNRQDQAYEQDPEGIESDVSSIGEKSPSKSIKHLSKQQSQQQVQQVKQLQDDIKQEEIPQRAMEIQKMMGELNYNFKQCATAQFPFKGVTAYKLLQILILQGQITISGKKYKNFNEHYKKNILQHKDIEVTQFQPAISQHLNPDNIKLTCPSKLTRVVNSTVPVPNSGIPFMPKSAKAKQNHSLYIISKHKWVMDTELENSGVPYSDCFKVYYRTVCESRVQYCKIATKFYINFIKSTMMKTIIESKTQQQSSIQMKKQYDEFKKYLAQLDKQKAKKMKDVLQLKNVDSTQSKESEQTDSQQIMNGVQQNERIQQLQQKLNEVNEKHEIAIKQLSGKVSAYQNMLIGMLVLYLISLLFWIT